MTLPRSSCGRRCAREAHRIVGLAISLLGCAVVAGRELAPIADACRPVFIVAHQDDWQLFMGDVAAELIRRAPDATFIYLTAGDGGREASYWKARESGALSSVSFALGQTPPDRIGQVQAAGDRQLPLRCEDVNVDAVPVRRCLLGETASYFLRLPDGNHEGEGFESTGSNSLTKLQAPGASPLGTVDGSHAFASWASLVQTTSAILRLEQKRDSNAQREVCIHSTDPETDFNPRDHPDHRAAGRVAREVASSTRGRLHLYAGYSTYRWPSNTSARGFADKAALFMAYDRARVLVKPEWSAYMGGPHAYSAWLSRTYVRPVGFSGRPSWEPQAKAKEE